MKRWRYKKIFVGQPQVEKALHNMEISLDLLISKDLANSILERSNHFVDQDLHDSSKHFLSFHQWIDYVELLDKGFNI